MAISLQNLRSTVSGVQPNALLAGQLCFNIADKIVFVGDGSDFKTDFNGDQVAGVPGQGWYSMPMSNEAFSEQFVPNPAAFGDIPQDGQVLTWDQAVGHPIWSFSGGGAGSRVYQTTNDAVAAAPGSTLTQKINNAAGIVAPDPYDFCVVTGDPGDVFQGLYYYSVNAWVKCAQYAFPDAAQVPYSNNVSGLSAVDVQEAIDENVVLTAAAQGTADQAFADAAIAQQTANDALPKAGGTMTGNITFAAGQGIVFPVGTLLSISDSTSTTSSTTAASSTAVAAAYTLADEALPKSGGIMTGTIDARTINIVPGYNLSFNNGIAGSITGVVDSVNSSSQTLVPTANAVKTTYDYAATKLPLAGGTMTGTITFAAGQAFPISGIDIASTTQLGVVRIGTNVDVTVGGTISVKTADTANLGLVRIGTNIDVTAGLISVKTASSSDLGLVQTGANIVNVAGNISILDATTGNKGVVQLYDDVNSNSTTLALTARQGQSLQNQIDTLTFASNVTLAGGYDATTGTMDSVTTQGLAQGFTVGGPLPAPTAAITDYYVIVSQSGSIPQAAQNGDWFLCDGTQWIYLGVGARPSSASYTQQGIVQLADAAATLAGTSDILAITPDSLFLNTTDSVSTTDSHLLASATAVKTAYDIGAAAIPCSAITGQGAILTGTSAGNPVALPVGTDGQVLVANSACSTGLEWVSDTPGDVTSVTGTSPITVDNSDPQNPIVGIDPASTLQPGAVQLDDTVTSLSTTEAATANAAKTAYDAGIQGQVDAAAAQATADAALPKAGGTMTGDITFSGAGNGVIFDDASSIEAISDSVSTNSSVTAASSTAVKAAYDAAAAAVPLAGGTMTGDLVFSGAGIGVVFNDLSTLEAISDSVSTTSSVTAASSTAVKSAYDLANAALPLAGGTLTGTVTFAVGQTFPISGIQDATTSQKGVVQIGSNIQVSSGTISVNTATTGQLGVVQIGSNIQVSSGTISVLNSSTTQPGVVQLNNTVASTSTTEALTANQGYQLQQQINALSTSNNVTFAGTFNAATSQMVTVTNEGAAVGFAIGSGLPTPTASIAEYFVIVSVAGTTTPPGGSPTAANVGDWFLASATSWTYIAAGYIPPSASTTTPGVVELATNAETQAGVNSSNAVVPSALQAKMSDSTSTTSSTCIASSTAVKSAYDLANAAVPNSCYTATGALTAGTGLGTVGTLSVGTDGQFLSANSTCTTGLQWCTISLACVPCSAFTGVGVLLAGTGASTFSALPAGTSGQFLVADTACANGVKWCSSSAAAICGFTCTLTPFNTALGGLAGAALTGLSVANTAIGYAALDSETSGDFNTAVGHNALTAQNGSTGNTVVGGNAGAQVTTGACNTVMGYNAADALTTGSNNVAIGFNSLGAAVSATNNVAVGMNALALSTTGCQVAVGYCALASNGTGVSNTAVGYFSLSQLLAGSQNTAVGFGTGQVLSGQSNTLIGYNAGNSVTTASGNTLVGCSAGTGITTQDGHVAIGSQTLVGVLDVNNRNLVAVGTCALRAVTTGLNNIGIGFCAGALITTGGCNIAIGAGALDSVTTTANNIGVGFSALTSITSGSENIAIGTCAGVAVTTGTDVVAIGHNAAFTQSTGSQSVHIGTCAGRSANAVGVTTIGFCAGQASTTAGCITYLGWTAGRNATGTNNTYVGALTGCAASNTSACGTLLGFCAGSAITTGNGNSLIGFQAGRFVTTGASNVALGSAALQTATTGSSNIAIGCGALANVGTTSGNTAVGHRAGLNATGSNNVVVGCEAGSQLSTGSTNVLIGNTAGDAVTSGSNNTIIGDVAGSAALADNLILAAGSTIKLQVNENGAVGVGSTPSYGTSGQILSSTGTAGAAAWTSSLPQVTAPTASTDAGVQGQIASDSTYFYMYTGGRWQRIAWDTTTW